MLTRSICKGAGQCTRAARKLTREGPRVSSGQQSSVTWLTLFKTHMGLFLSLEIGLWFVLRTVILAAAKFIAISFLHAKHTTAVNIGSGRNCRTKEQNVQTCANEFSRRRTAWSATTDVCERRRQLLPHLSWEVPQRSLTLPCEVITVMWELRCPRQSLWRMPSSGI
jgi:hypothetical protein